MVAAPIFGYLGDRFNRKVILSCGIFFWSIVTLSSSFIGKEVRPSPSRPDPAQPGLAWGGGEGEGEGEPWSALDMLEVEASEKGMTRLSSRTPTLPSLRSSPRWLPADHQMNAGASDLSQLQHLEDKTAVSGPVRRGHLDLVAAKAPAC